MPTPSEPGPGPDVPWYIPDWMLDVPDPDPAVSAPDPDRREPGGRWQEYRAHEAYETGWDDRRRRRPRSRDLDAAHGDGPDAWGSSAWGGTGGRGGRVGHRVAGALRDGLPFMVGMALVVVTATRPDLVSVSALCAATGFVVGFFVDAVLERAACPRPRSRRPGVALSRLLRQLGRTP
jgi:hypothetical protein